MGELSNIVHHPYQSVQCVHAWRDFAQQSYERLLSVSSQCELLALHNGTYTAQFSASERGNLAWRVEGSAISVLTLGNKVILYCIVYPLRASRMQVGMSDCSFYTLVLIICLFLFEYPSKWSTYTAVSLLHSWCHVKLLPPRRTFRVRYTTMHQITVSLYSKPHT